MSNGGPNSEWLNILKSREKYNKKVVNKYIEVLQECNDLRIAFSKAADARDKLAFENKILKLEILELKKKGDGLESMDIER
jgi:hypothetical protein